MSSPLDATIKAITVGDSGVGKTSILNSFATGAFNPDTTPTIGRDLFTKRVTVTDPDTQQVKQIALYLWDTAGQERFRCLPASYYHNAHAVVLLYDVTAPETFAHVQKWLTEAEQQQAEAERVFLLVGNKTDLCANDECMAVDKSVAQRFAQESGMLFALTSAKTMRGIAEAFDELARSVYDRNRGDPDFFRTGKKGVYGGNNNNNNNNNSGSGCC